MGAGKRALFERCPLCHKGVVNIATRKSSAGLAYGIEPCSACGAIFSSSGDGGLRLAFCDPRKLAVARGLARSGDGCIECTPFAGCLIDRILAKTEWDALGQGKAMGPWVAFVDEGREQASAIVSPEMQLMRLTDEEVVHHESTVYLGKAEFVGAGQGEARLLLTNSRIVIVHHGVMIDIRLADVENVELSFPGFVITAKNVPHPLYCLPAPGDSVYHAILGALKRID